MKNEHQKAITIALMFQKILYNEPDPVKQAAALIELLAQAVSGKPPIETA